MKKTLKRVVALVMALAMVLTTCVAAAAAEPEDVTPVIYIHGLNGADVMNNLGTDDETAMFTDFDLDAALAKAEEFNSADSIKAVLNGEKSISECNADIVIDVLACVLAAIPFNCDEDGEPLNGSGVETFDAPLSDEQCDDYTDTSLLSFQWFGEHAMACSIADEIGYDNVYAFMYDWRLDACENAEKLRDFVKMVKEQTGSDKVTLAGDSEAGIVMSAYLDKYGRKDDLDRLVFVNAAFAGVSMTGLYNEDMVGSDVALKTYIAELGECVLGQPYSDITEYLAMGLSLPLDAVADILQMVADSDELTERLYLEVLKPFFGNCPAFYEFIPYAQFDDAMEKMTDMGFLSKDSGVYAKLQKYHKVQGRLTENLQQAEKDGIDVAIIANYGTPSIPITSDYVNQTDGLIDTKYASAGATVADYGSTLDAEGKYVSPDKTIDASTCALPDSTWFVKDLMHCFVIQDQDLMGLFVELVTGPTAAEVDDIYASTGYTQFLQMDNGIFNQTLTNIDEDTELDGWFGVEGETFFEVTFISPIDGEEYTYRVDVA